MGIFFKKPTGNWAEDMGNDLYGLIKLGAFTIVVLSIAVAVLLVVVIND